MNAPHNLLPIGARSLHPTEAFIVTVATRNGSFVGQCACSGVFIIGRNEIDRYVRFKEHVAAVQAVADGRGHA